MFSKVIPLASVIAMWIMMAGSIALIAAQPAEEAPSPTPPPATTEATVDDPLPEEAARPAAAYRAKQVLGSTVSIQGNVSIGQVDDIVFADDGFIEYLIVQNEGKLVTVPWEAAKFDFHQRRATVDISKEQFRAVPRYTTNRYPTFYEPSYRVDTYKHYNMKPEREVRQGLLRRR